MQRIFKTKHPLRRIASVKYAASGILHILSNEINFRIQLVIAAVTVFFGIYFKISNVEWALLVVSLGMLLTAEMVNTVVEELMDHMFKEYHDVAKIIKDLSAGFVLVTACVTLLIIILLFGPYIR